MRSGATAEMRDANACRNPQDSKLAQVLLRCLVGVCGPAIAEAMHGRHVRPVVSSRAQLGSVSLSASSRAWPSWSEQGRRQGRLHGLAKKLDPLLGEVWDDGDSDGEDGA